MQCSGRGLRAYDHYLYSYSAVVPRPGQTMASLPPPHRMAKLLPTSRQNYLARPPLYRCCG
jgi:hypothetical protein